MLELKELNDIDVLISEFKPNNNLAEVKQFFLNEFEVTFAKHLLKYKKAFAIGKQFAKNITDEA